MINIKDECTGCMACINSCPVKAIVQEINEYGYVMPVVHPEHCVGCGVCERVCPLMKNVSDEGETKQLPLKAFSVYHKDRDVVKRSSSGGAFYALASLFLEQGGIVFGCYYDIEQKSAYLTDTDHVKLDDLLTSKYVESYIKDGFQEVERQLQIGRKVLFCGTPCQAAGLRGFLRRSYDRLLVVDFTCGAVSAQSYLKDYLENLEKKYRSGLSGIYFRDKHYGWGQYCFLAEFENGRIYRRTAMSDPYFFCFLRSSMQRLSCHGCRFSENHVSDIILADFWKCDHFDVDRNDRRGISLVLVMTDKGKQAMEAADRYVYMEELDPAEASYNLISRSCPKEKLPEIYADQKCASKEGVATLRKRLLGPKKRFWFRVRQFIMDHPCYAKRFPEAAGKGQIME